MVDVLARLRFDRCVKNTIMVYVLLSFGIAWVCWAVCGLVADGSLKFIGLTPLLIGGSFGPFIAAGICTWLSGGFREMALFYARVLQWRMGWGVFAVAFALLPGLAIIAAYIYAWQMHGGFGFQMGWGDVPMAYLWLFVLGGPVAEEFGWSYLADRLSERLGGAMAILSLGGVWGFWHLPLFYLIVPGLLQHYMPFGLFLIFSVVMRFLFCWAYYRGGQNLLSNLIFHNSLNFALSIVVIVPPVIAPEHLRLWYLTGLAAVVSIGLWQWLPPRMLLAGKQPPGAKA